MSFRDMCALIAEDYRNHERQFTRPGFRALAVYRFGAWRMTVRSRWLRMPLSLIFHTAFRHCRNVYGIEIPHTATIGRGVIVEHQGGIVVHGQTVIGDNSIIRQNCTFGIRSPATPTEAPTIGARVDVGAGAVILGRITIGDDAVIGANAVVLQDVPAGALAVGIPAVIKLRTR
jgi:serine O-acetyltransferase